MIFLICLGSLTCLYIAIVFWLHYKYPELHWNWDKIDISKMNFPDNFSWGTATASHQVEGDCTNNNWYMWENAKDENNKPRIKDSQKAGAACDHWNRYKEDIKLIKKIGVTQYRFSLEWSKIEAKKGSYDQNVINHYSDVIDALIQENITPVITLHHFTNPIWFDRLGGFEKEENINHFVSFCKMVFEKYSPRVKDWCTINEPEVYSVMGYFAGIFPPGKKEPQLAVEVLKNLLIAHTTVYNSLKNLPNGKDSKIGIVKNIMQFDLIGDGICLIG